MEGRDWWKGFKAETGFLQSIKENQSSPIFWPPTSVLVTLMQEKPLDSATAWICCSVQNKMSRDALRLINPTSALKKRTGAVFSNMYSVRSTVVLYITQFVESGLDSSVSWVNSQFSEQMRTTFIGLETLSRYDVSRHWQRGKQK